MIKILLLIVSGLLIIVTLIQSENGSGISKIFNGSDNLNLFANKKDRGIDKVYVYVTAVLLGLFLILAFVGGRVNA